MCGRYQLALAPEALRRLFAIEGPVAPFPPRHSIAPTEPVHVVRVVQGVRRLVLMRWGLWPAWMKDPARFPLLINARAETAAHKAAFRAALRRRRVLVPATGYYEWERRGGRRIPLLFQAPVPLAFAGLAETWHGPNGEEVDTVAILTTVAAGAPAQVHGRMPLTVPQQAWTDWLDPAAEDGEAALALAGREHYTARAVPAPFGRAGDEERPAMEPDAPPRGRPEQADLFGWSPGRPVSGR